jgi:hypothetical protein
MSKPNRKPKSESVGEILARWRTPLALEGTVNEPEEPKAPKKKRQQTKTDDVIGTDSDRGYGWGYFRSRDRELLQKLGRLMELTHGEAAMLRVIGAVERELDAMAEEAWKRSGGGA